MPQFKKSHQNVPVRYFSLFLGGQKGPLLHCFFLPVYRSCYMAFPSLQLSLALSCVMGLVMFARYCGEDHSAMLPTSSNQMNLTSDAVSQCVISAFQCSAWTKPSSVLSLFCFMDHGECVNVESYIIQSYVKKSFRDYIFYSMNM